MPAASRFCRIVLCLLLLAGCTPGAAPTASFPPPTTLAMTPVGAATPTDAARPSLAPPQGIDVWLEQPFGADKLAVLFYDESPDSRCVGYMVQATSTTACVSPASDVLAITWGIETDSDGNMFTIVAGRVFRAEVAVVSVVFADGESFPVTVDGGGIILLAPGARTPQEAVPINEFGNVVGKIYRFVGR